MMEHYDDIQYNSQTTKGPKHVCSHQNRRHQDDIFVVSRQQCYKSPNRSFSLDFPSTYYTTMRENLLSSITMFSPVPFAAILIPGCFS
jgi:hypothetical protein